MHSCLNSFWVKIIKALHGKEGGFDVQSCNFNGTWSRIIDSSNYLHLKGIIPLNSLCFRVGCGTRIRFWKDIWIGDSPLHIRYNRLYRLDQDKDCLIIDRIENGQWKWNWSRTNIGVRNTAYLRDLLTEISLIDINVDEDSCVWWIAKDDIFTVGEMRRIIDSMLLPSLVPPTSWYKVLSRKINIFLWRLYLDRLLHRLNLSSHGMDIQSISCHMCNGNVESSSHIFFECDIASKVWRMVRNWCDIPLPSFSSHDQMRSWLCSWQVSKEKNHRMTNIFASLCWWLWRGRLTSNWVEWLKILCCPRVGVLFGDLVGEILGELVGELEVGELVQGFLLLFGSLASSFHGECILMRDFNEVRNPDERMGSVFNPQGAADFNDFISSTGLYEVQLEGYSFTWSHPSASKMSKLDRFLVTDGILTLFPNISAVCLDKHLSDHRPILLHDVPADYGPTPFRFYQSWTKMSGFVSMVSQAWMSFDLNDSNDMIRFNKKLQALKKYEMMKQLQDIKSLDSSDYLQKAKIQWAIEGDENSKFFHGVINRRRSNLAVKGIMVDGTWMDDPGHVKNEFRSHFANRFHSPSILGKINFLFPNRLSSEQAELLESPISAIEIRNALFTFGFTDT
ncbi:RNA-directed DNA polymerase, eukaryota [Tanacetum coccineum]